ncbi:putative suppressor of disruption of TFIIS [Recurvomyces mirabilis]|uniref:Suppressor of disruption of TFIIS n=1 Tax=Recurvomyces mirabilis TaxID=574656 RepID=A0AAE0TPK2_9PEZI|nr:putative suppressor of disruption of TFIIS [Recurvomyces mirabilis]KAK5156190.1 suppressor of deletion of TFIIS [Recurvomyces mirabilis]
MSRPTTNGITNGTPKHRQPKTFFFDIDNCLYPKSYKIHEQMGELIDVYFQNHLSLSEADACELHQRYYKDYGLAIEGLVRHHKVDPLEYNEKVDDALPLDDIIKPNPGLRKLLQDIDQTKVKLWLFTNAYITHGQRVVKLLGIEEMFEGITYCDYGAKELVCKPRREMYDKAMRESGSKDVSECYFVDDSGLNVTGAKQYGWKAAHLLEPGTKAPRKQAGDWQIEDLEELREIFPEVFRKG